IFRRIRCPGEAVGNFSYKLRRRGTDICLFSKTTANKQHVHPCEQYNTKRPPEPRQSGARRERTLTQGSEVHWAVLVLLSVTADKSASLLGVFQVPSKHRHIRLGMVVAPRSQWRYST